VARLDANLAAIKVVKELQAEGRAATPAEQEVLARWSGWGAVAAVFADKPGEDRAFAPARQQLRTLLTDKEYAAARLNTINAHYTGPVLAQAMWDGLAAFGFTGGRVLEPGCGSGNFVGLAPLGTAMAGIELDPVRRRRGRRPRNITGEGRRGPRSPAAAAGSYGGGHGPSARGIPSRPP